MTTISYSPMTRAVLRYLGEMIQLSREENGITALELAERVGISDATHADIESGKTDMDVGIVIEVALTAGVNLFEAKQKASLDAPTSGQPPSPMFPKRIYENRRPVFDDF